MNARQKHTLEWELIIGLVMAFILYGCQGSPTQTTKSQNNSISGIQITMVAAINTPTIEPYAFKTSAPGKVSLHGTLVVLDPTSLVPGADDSIFLVPIDESSTVSGTPSFKKGEVPQADVDERTGEYVFTNIAPGKYMIMIETQSGSQFPTHWMSTNSFAIVTIDSTQMNQTVELKPVSVP
jgi:hypothetical protein